MNYRVWSLSAMLLLCPAAAQAGDFYLGASAGIMDNNVSGFDNAVNAGVLAGYDVYSKEIFAVSLETEFTTTVADGDAEIHGSKGDWDIDTKAAYIAARLGERAYLKVRYGVVRSDISVKVGGVKRNNSDTSGSWGGAIGWMFTDTWGVQADGTLADSDVTYWNLGVKYQFR